MVRRSSKTGGESQVSQPCWLSETAKAEPAIVGRSRISCHRRIQIRRRWVSATGFVGPHVSPLQSSREGILATFNTGLLRCNWVTAMQLGHCDAIERQIARFKRDVAHDAPL